MRIYKRNHEYKGMFWYNLLWLSDSVPNCRDLFFENLEYLLPYNSRLSIKLKDWKFYYGGENE